MLQFLIRVFLIFSTLISVFATASAEKKQEILWTAVFSDVTPVRSKISQEYCVQHTPSVIVTTIDQITGKDGIKSLNGVNIRYLSYKTIEKDNLFFNIVDAVVSGKEKNGKEWSMAMKLYEQTLSSVGVTYTVWSTRDCKGTFLGTPTVVNQN